jgi:hypothetical protein
MDAGRSLAREKILAPKLPIDNLNATLDLKNDFELRAGFVRRRQRPHGNIQHIRRIETAIERQDDARLRQLDLRRFLGESSFAQNPQPC